MAGPKIVILAGEVGCTEIHDIYHRRGLLILLSDVSLMEPEAIGTVIRDVYPDFHFPEIKDNGSN